MLLLNVRRFTFMSGNPLKKKNHSHHLLSVAGVFEPGEWQSGQFLCEDYVAHTSIKELITHAFLV